MNIFKKIVLLLAALSLVRVLVTTTGLLISTIPLIFELSSNERRLKISYELVATYCSFVTVLLVFIGITLYREAKSRNPLRFNFVFTSVLFLMLGLHFALVIVGNSDEYIVQFAQSFLWLPIVAGLIALFSILIPRLKIFREK